MVLKIPRPRVTQEQLKRFLTDPEIVTLEILFVVLTVSNVFVLYRILLDICPFPVTVTWFQLVFGLMFAYVLGEIGREFPRFAFFPPMTIEPKLYEGLTVPTMVYLGMIVMANVLLQKIPSIASFPAVVSFAVTLHHLSRFVGCGQMYLPVRWISLAIMLAGFLLSVSDPSAAGRKIFPVAVIYAFFSSTFRAWCLEKAMHVCNGRGNVLHNHKVVMGICILPVVAFLFNELAFFKWMPKNPFHLYTWQVWGCLATAGILPFVKNVVANRMIRHTGQAPWRFLEIVSMFLLFVIGDIVYDNTSFIAVIAFILVFAGRIIGMLDALSKDSSERRRANVQETAQHGAVMPQYNYDPTGVADTFHREEYPAVEMNQNKSGDTSVPLYTSMGEDARESSATFNTNPLLAS